MMGSFLEPTHLILVLVIALFVLGPKRLPAVGRSLGDSMREFRHGITAMHDKPVEAEPVETTSAPSAELLLAEGPAAPIATASAVEVQTVSSQS